jgi:hypothetical protein
MSATIYALAAFAIGIGGWAIARVIRVGRIIRTVRGPRVVTCLVTGMPAAVTVDLRYAIQTGLRQPVPAVRLRACSQSAYRAHCRDACLRQAADPASAPLAIVTRGVTDEPCVYCGRPIDQVAFLDHYAAFLAADGRTIPWPQIPPERLRETVAARPPVCWDCHIAETFRRMCPELVTDRPWPRA